MSLTGLALSGKRILITGGTGFIGSRLVERLVIEEAAKARVLVHHPANAARVARLPIEIARGDVLNAADVQRAVEGCEIIFHCAYGSAADEALQRRVTIDGTRNILDAGLRNQVKRIVYFSTLLVYGVTADGDLDETAPRRYFGNAYSDSKLDSEALAFDYIRRHRLPLVILQPTAVYGPFARQWTVQVLEKLKTGRLILVNGGEGLRNAVYVDDLVSAAILAAVKEKALGEAFLISGDAPVTWREFYRAHERMLGLSDRLMDLSAGEASALYRRAKKVRGVVAEMRVVTAEHPDLGRRLLRTRELAFAAKTLRRLIPDRLWQQLKSQLAVHGRIESRPGAVSQARPHLLGPAAIRFQAAKTTVRIDKARRILDYRPAFEFSYGMQLTEQWAHWANLLGPTRPVLDGANAGSKLEGNH
jgi:nucleoside-diphosphate-sugar epimerase